MRLLLHWLLWDLRRFRWLLLAWVVMLAAFAVFVGYLNAHLLSVPSRLLKWPEIIASVLGILEVFILLPILSADPACGARPFWKTRPPAGMAVAGARAVLVVGFFLLLPMLAWWCVLRACGLESGQTAQWDAGSWMDFIFWVEALAISSLALAAGATRGAGGTVGRLLTGIGVLMIPVLLSMPFWESDSRAAAFIMSAGKAVIEGAYNMRMPAVWLLAGLGCFLLGRRQRTPGLLIRSAVLFVPLLVAFAGGLMPREHRAFTPLPPLDVRVANAIKVGQPFLRSGMSPAGPVYGNRSWRNAAGQTWRFRLHHSGVPEDHSAIAEWRELKLTGPGGEVVSARPDLNGEALWTSGDGSMPVTPVAFPAPELSAVSMAACRAEGLLSLTFRKRHSVELPLSPGATVNLPKAVVRLTAMNPDARPGLGGMGQPMFTFTAEIFDWSFEPRFWLEHTGTGRRLELNAPGVDIRFGYFITRGQKVWRTGPDLSSPMMSLARFFRDAREGRFEDWRLKVTWFEKEGVMEKPVTLDPVIVRKQPGDGRSAVEVIDALALPAGASKDEVRRQTLYALGLIEASGVQLAPDTPDPVVRAVERFLAKVPREHLEVLLGIAEEEPPMVWAGVEQFYPFDGPLRRRIAELLTPEDVPSLRQRAGLFHYLSGELVARKLITRREADGPEWEDRSDGTLRQRWEDSVRTELLCIPALEQAARRGLPWVPGAVAEVMDLAPGTGEAIHIHSFMSALSDCPQAADAGMTWLRDNAAKLNWDASRQRWVLP